MYQTNWQFSYEAGRLLLVSMSFRRVYRWWNPSTWRWFAREHFATVKPSVNPCHTLAADTPGLALSRAPRVRISHINDVPDCIEPPTDRLAVSVTGPRGHGKTTLCIVLGWLLRMVGFSVEFETRGNNPASNSRAERMAQKMDFKTAGFMVQNCKRVQIIDD